MNLHVFITVDHFRRCHEAALFGVRPSSLNQLAQVRDGDRAYIYARKAAVLYGPYICRGPVYYLGPRAEAPVWEWADPSARAEKYRYVVRLGAEAEVRRFPMASLYALARARGIDLGPADFVKRSVFSFLPAEGARLAAAWEQAPGQSALPFLPPPRPVSLAGCLPVDGRHLDALLKHEKLDESLLEFLLAREGGALAAEMGASPAFNQLRIDPRGDRIDLVYASDESLFIIELKTGRRDAEARRDILRYELWARGKRRDLASRLGLAAASPLVTPVLVAAGGPPRPVDCRIYDWRVAAGPARLTFERVA